MEEMEKNVILQEKINLLRGFFASCPDSMIEDVLRRPDVNGDVSLASQALGSFMEFDQPDADVFSYVEYETEEAVDDYMSSKNARREDDDCKNSEDDWRNDGDTSSEEEFERKGVKSAEDDHDAGKIQRGRQFVTNFDDIADKKQQSSEYSRFEEKPIAKEKNESFFSSLCASQAPRVAPRVMSSSSERKMERKSPQEDEAKTTHFTEWEESSQETSKMDNPKSGNKKTLQRTWELSSDSDEDIESYFKSNFGNNEDSRTEKKVDPPKTFRKDSNSDFRRNYQTQAKSDDSRTVQRIPVVRSPLHQKPQEERRPVEKSCEDDSLALRGRTTAPISRKESNNVDPDLVPMIDLKKPTQTAQRVLPEAPPADQPVKGRPCLPVSGKTSTEAKPLTCTVDQSRGRKSDVMETDVTSSKKPKSKNKRGRGRKGSKDAQKQNNKPRVSAKSNEDQVENLGEEKESSGLFEPKRILVSGLNEKSTNDALSNYMELTTGKEVVSVKFLGQGRAVVDTEEHPDFERVQDKVGKRKLDGMQLSVELIRVCDSILVSGLSDQVTKDTILLYFENVRRSGGGDVKDVNLNRDGHCAVVYFEDASVIGNVVGREHSLEGRQLTVEKFYPQITPQIQSVPTDSTPPPSSSTESEEPKKKLKRDISPDRQNVDIEVDRHVMQFIMTGPHRRDLEEKLSGCKAEIEWSSGSDSARVWKKANSGYVKKWSNACQTVVCEFLDQFEKFSVPLQASVKPVIKNALPRLIRHLPKGKALCEKHDSKQEIIVVCLECEKDMISKSVDEFLGIIEKEEVRKTYKKETVKISKREHVLLLEQTGFAEEMKSKHADLEVVLDKEKQELYFEGPREQFTDSKIRYFHIMNAITEQPVPLPSAGLGDIVGREPGRKYLEAKLTKENIKAKIFVEQRSSIKIMAVNSSACQKAVDCINESMELDNVSFHAQDAFIFESAECIKLFSDLQEDQLLVITVQRNSVGLEGMAEAVSDAKQKIDNFIEQERKRSRSRPISKGLLRFLDEHFSGELKGVVSSLKHNHVSVQLDKSKGVIEMTGTREGLGRCDECLDGLLASVAEEQKEYSSPGLDKLLFGERGQRNLKLIEMENEVVIEMSKRVKDGVKDTSQGEVDLIEREERSLMEEKKKSREEAVQNSLDSQASGRVYDMCNFTTAEGIKVSWKYGCIENETADVLVNSATSNLGKLTACGKALRSVGGHRFSEACKQHTNVPAGDIVYTGGGRLSCQYVIHAVCCHWDNGKGASEKLLRDLVSKILHQCDQLGMASICFPTIGTGQHGFPEDVVFRVYKEEIKRYSVAAYTTGQQHLTEIRIIVFKTGLSATLSNIVNQVTQPVQQFLSAITPTVANSRVASFGSVCVSVHEGDITQQPTAVDATINVLHASSQLTSGGGVSNKILQIGGQTIQQELDAAGAKPPGSIVETSAGSIPNTSRILHFIPTSTDVQGLQTSIERCFDYAKSLRLGSVAIPAIGTAGFNISAKDSADLIVTAAKNFSAANYKLDVHIVVFQKAMTADFETALQNQNSSSVASVHQPKVLRKRPKLKLHSSLKTLKTGAAKEVVILDVFASSSQSVDTCLREVDKFIKEHTTTKKIEHEKAFDVLVKHWSEVEDLAGDNHVTISCSKSSSVVEIEGLVANVSDCKDELSSLITSHVEEERKSSQVEFISKNVQWYHFQGNQSVAYAKDLNVLIEMAYMENKDTVEITRNGGKYEVDLTAKTETNQRNGQVETITRKQMGDSSSEIAVPQHWTTQPASQVVQLVTLQTSYPEYQQVLTHFKNRGGTAGQIIKIERVQNPGLYKAYLVKKESMKGAENEQQLFHGTRVDNTVAINVNNFNRSYAGINGVVYGNGVYFARDASYSLRYAMAGGGGYYQMYVARVLVGRYTIGQRGMKAPPSRNDPSNPGLLFDSLVDNMHNPSIFVIFQDHQCYPEYLITFR